MLEDSATLIVKRVGGFSLKGAQHSLIVIVDGSGVGHTGEEISIQPGDRNVTVKAGYFTCPSQQIELRSGATTTLEYHASWLAWASIAFSFFLFIALSLPAALFLEPIQRFFGGSRFGTLLMVSVLLFWGWLAFAAPLRILAAMGIHSHTLEASAPDT